MMCMICCACNSVLQKDGTGLKWDPRVSQPDAFCGSAQELEVHAEKHGWSTDSDNHRCPACRVITDGSSRIGRVVDAGIVVF